MADGCRLSSDVFDVLKSTYQPLRPAISEEELYHRISVTLSTPPQLSVLRVNTLNSTISKAKQQLGKLLDRQNEESGLNLVCENHKHIPDILVTSSNGKQKDILPNAKEVIVDELCGAAILRGADVFACGVLGTPPELVKGEVVSVYADLDGLCKKGFKKHYDGQKYFVGNGIVILARNEIFKKIQPRGVAVKMNNQRYAHPSFAPLDPLIFFPQNLPSTLVAHNLEPSQGDIILDMCAAPGGKTSHAAMLMGNVGRIFAIDKSKSKVKKLEEMCHRLNWSCVRCFAADSTKLCDVSPSSEGIPREDQHPPFQTEVFDKIILDPPCSALGQRPQLQCKTTKSELASFAVYQKKIFHQAVKLLKPGGTLIYSTCTLNVDENENQIAWALETFPELNLIPQKLHLGGTGIAGHNLSEEHCLLVQRFDPCLISITKDCFKSEDFLSVNKDTIGFFIAKFIKSDDITC
ncbi:tRNA (cytosine(72)-C(5))-methyltransferase NSUN6-like [Rhopilema esculentum]|uniref:tRNA (cytosine(72)-C(5))-methyltransferase NSUN6-like n=1 Tax=Rhopilema esculentum TaxID=499914 RepID=UPI0031D9728A|eukprot:gene12000-2583_t